MKKISCLISILLVSGIINAQFLPFYGNKTSSNTLLMMDLKGKVKSVEQKVFIANDSLGKTTKGERKFDNSGSVNTTFLIQLDLTGRSIKETYTLSANYFLEVYHKYDSIKNIETVEEHSPEYKSGKISFRTTYKYNKEGKVIQVDATQFYKDNSPSANTKSIYKYDLKGNLIERTLFPPKTKSLKTIYKYDAKGNMISLTTYGEAGKIWSRETFKTDENGNVSEHAYYVVDTNTIEHSFTYLYDKNNNVIQKNYINPEAKSKKYTYIRIRQNGELDITN